MAQVQTTQLVDDLDGTVSDDVDTVHFGLDGATYEIELTAANAENLRKDLYDYVAHARRTGGRVQRGGRSSTAAAKDTSAQVREWANANGYELSQRGRIPNHVTEAYAEAQAETKTTTTKRPSAAGKTRSTSTAKAPEPAFSNAVTSKAKTKRR